MNLLQNFHLAVTGYLYHGRRMVPLQTFTTRHSNRKLFIVMALSTTFTQCAPETFQSQNTVIEPHSILGFRD